MNTMTWKDFETIPNEPNTIILALCFEKSRTET